MTRRRRILFTILQITALAAAVAIAVFFFARDMDFDALLTTFRRAHAMPLFMAIALALPIAIARSVYWQVFLRSSARERSERSERGGNNSRQPREDESTFISPPTAEPVPFRLLLRYTLASNTANTLLPARAGDAMRVWLLHNKHRVPISVAGAVVALEKTGDVLSLGLLVAPLLWLLPTVPTAVAGAIRTIAAVIVVAIVLVTAGVVLGLFTHRFRWLSGLAAARRPAVLARGFGAIFSVWIMDVMIGLLVMWAVGLEVRIEAALLVLLFVNLAIAIPASPGQLGTHELGSLAALRIIGAPTEQAVAFAVLNHAVQLLPVVVMGLVDARALIFKVR